MSRTQKKGVKFDVGKDPMELMSPLAMRETSKVLEFGARKYAKRNWEKGMEWGRLYGAAMRHLTAYWSGEDNDPETGLSHLAHASCCIMFMQHYKIHNVGTDDRPRYSSSTSKKRASRH